MATTIRELVASFGIKTDKQSVSNAQAAIDQVKKSALIIGAVAGAAAFAIKKLVESGSEIQETTNKFGAVFGEAGSEVQQQLNDIRDRTGATNLQLQMMASNIGALIKPALGSAEAAGKMAAGVAELALDIASFNNVSADDAVGAIRSDRKSVV